jgi:acylphosphatase
VGAISSSSLRRTVWFFGHVQGVGFRAITVHVASRFAVSGCVENLPDGRVQLVVEGEAAEVERFLSQLRAERRANIKSEQMVDGPATGEFSEFRIRR